MKEPRGLLGKYYLNKREMRELVMHNSEPASTREATERLVIEQSIVHPLVCTS